MANALIASSMESMLAVIKPQKNNGNTRAINVQPKIRYNTSERMGHTLNRFSISLTLSGLLKIINRSPFSKVLSGDGRKDSHMPLVLRR